MLVTTAMLNCPSCWQAKMTKPPSAICAKMPGRRREAAPGTGAGDAGEVGRCAPQHIVTVRSPPCHRLSHRIGFHAWQGLHVAAALWARHETRLRDLCTHAYLQKGSYCGMRYVRTVLMVHPRRRSGKVKWRAFLCQQAFKKISAVNKNNKNRSARAA